MSNQQRFERRHSFLAGISTLAFTLAFTQSTLAAQVDVNGNDTPTITGATPAQAAPGNPGSTGTVAVGTSGAGISTLITNTVTGGQGGNATGGSGGNGGGGATGFVFGGSGTVTVGDNGTTATAVNGGSGGTGDGVGSGGNGTTAIDATGAGTRILNIHQATVTPGSGGAGGAGGAAGTAGTTAIGIGNSTTLNLGNAATSIATTNSLGGAVTATGSNTIVNFYDTNTITGAFSSEGGRVNLGVTKDTTLNGAFTLSTGGTGGTLANTIGATQATSGQINNGNNAGGITLNNSVLEPRVVGVGTANGEKIVLITNVNNAAAVNVGTAAARTATGAVAADTSYNTLVRRWSIGAGGTNGFGGLDKFGNTISATSLVLKTTINSATSIVGNRSSGQAAAFDTAANYTGNGTRSELVALNQAVQNLNTTDGVRRAADQLRPEVSGGTSQAAQNALNGVTGVTEARTQSLRTAAASQGSGIASGEALRGLGVWVQGFGSTASQNARDNYTGYDVQTYGMAVGGDVRVTDSVRAGLSFAYARGTVDETGNRSGNTLDVNSYIATAYASYTGSAVYVDVSANAGRHDYDSTRLVNVVSGTAKANFDGTQYGGKAEIGYPIALGSRASITPLASLAYSHLNVGSYSETGASGANLAVESQSVDSVRSGLGAKAGATIVKTAEWEVKPSLKAVWVHEFSRDAVDATARFAAGSTSFVTSGAKPAAEAAVLGASVDVVNVANITGSLTYDAEIKEGYVGHSGLMQLRHEF